MEELLKKFGKRKLYLIIYCTMSVLLLLLTVVLYMAFGRISYKDHNLKLKSIDDGQIVMSDEKSNELIMERQENYPYTSSLITVYYLDEIITYEYRREYPSYDAPVTIFTFPDGKQIIEEWFVVTFDEQRPSYMLTDEWILFNTLLNRYIDSHMHTGLVRLCVLGLVLLALGVASVIYPEVFWKIQHFLTVAEGEPTDFALAVNRIAGCFSMVLPFVFLVLFYFSELNLP